jgi:hypothetical protein
MGGVGGGGGGMSSHTKRSSREPDERGFNRASEGHRRRTNGNDTAVPESAVEWHRGDCRTRGNLMGPVVTQRSGNDQTRVVKRAAGVSGTMRQR